MLEKDFDAAVEEFEMVCETEILPRDTITNGETTLGLRSTGTMFREFEDIHRAEPSGPGRALGLGSLQGGGPRRRH